MKHPPWNDFVKPNPKVPRECPYQSAPPRTNWNAHENQKRSLLDRQLLNKPDTDNNITKRTKRMKVKAPR